MHACGVSVMRRDSEGKLLPSPLQCGLHKSSRREGKQQGRAIVELQHDVSQQVLRQAVERGMGTTRDQIDSNPVLRLLSACLTALTAPTWDRYFPVAQRSQPLGLAQHRSAVTLAAGVVVSELVIIVRPCILSYF